MSYGGNFGDCGSYRGTVVQIDPSKAAVEANWQTRANGGGIWAQGGLAGDGTYLFVTTGNTFGASQWSDGEGIIKLHPGLGHSDNPKDYFAPSNWKDLDNSDQDLGGTEAIPLNVAVAGGNPAKRVIAFGKDGNAYLADRQNLGGIGGAIQVLQVTNGAIRTAPAVYETDSATMVAYTSPASSHCSSTNIAALNVAASGSSPMTFAWCATSGGNGAPIVTTTDGKRQWHCVGSGRRGRQRTPRLRCAEWERRILGFRHVDEWPAPFPDHSRHAQPLLCGRGQHRLRVQMEVTIYCGSTYNVMLCAGSVSSSEPLDHGKSASC